jgi:hypothetical protein
MKNAWTRWIGIAATLSAALLGVSDAHAERIVLLQFSGRKASVLRDKVAESLERAGHTVVKSKASSRSSRQAIKRLGRKADAVVGGLVKHPKEGDWTVAISVSDPKKGTRLGDKIEFSNEWLPGLTKDLSDNVSRRVEAVLAGEEDVPVAPKTKPEIVDEPREASALEPEAPPRNEKGRKEKARASEPAGLADSPESSSEDSGSSDDVSPSEDDGVSDRGTDDTSAGSKGNDIFLRLRARGGFVRRNVDFSDDIYDRLRKQGTNIWVYQVQGELYPFDKPIGQHLGLIASYEGTLSGSVHDTDFDVTYPVEFQEFFGGIRARQPLGQHAVGFDLTFGRMNSGLDDVDGKANIPDLNYTLMRASLDFTLDFDKIQATASAGFRLPLGFGQASTADWFPRIGGYGFEASAGLQYPLSKRLTLEGLGSMRRYLLEMNSEPDDAVGGIAEVAGGAVDLYVSAYFGVAFTL